MEQSKRQIKIFEFLLITIIDMAGSVIYTSYNRENRVQWFFIILPRGQRIDGTVTDDTEESTREYK